MQNNKEIDEKIVIQMGAIDWQVKEINRLKAENEDLFYKLVGVMHFVDKWLDGKELEQDEVNRAATMREKTLRITEAQRTEIEEWKTLAHEGKEKVELLEIEKSAMQHRIDKQQAEIEFWMEKANKYKSQVEVVLEQKRRLYAEYKKLRLAAQPYLDEIAREIGLNRSKSTWLEGKGDNNVRSSD